MLFVYFYTVGLSVWEIELLLAVYGITLIFAPKFTKKFKNQNKQQITLIVGEMIKAFGLICFVVTKDVWILAIGQILSGLGYSLTAGTDSSLLRKLSDTYEEDKYEYKAVEAKSNSYMFISFLVAGVLGSVIFKIDPRLVFLLSIFANMLSLISARLINDTSEITETKIATVIETVSDEERLVNDKTIFFWKNYYALSRAFTLATFVGFLPYYFFIVVDVNLYYFSAILSLFNLFGFLSSRVIVKLEKSWGYKKLTVVTSCLLIVGLMVFCFSNNLLISVINISLLGLASGGVRPITMANINKKEMNNFQRTKILSSMEQNYGFWNALLLLSGGLILTFFGFKTLMVSFVLMYLILILLFYKKSFKLQMPKDLSNLSN
jgi:MFS family permease